MSAAKLPQPLDVDEPNPTFDLSVWTRAGKKYPAELPQQVAAAYRATFFDLFKQLRNMGTRLNDALELSRKRKCFDVAKVVNQFLATNTYFYHKRYTSL